MPTSPPWSLVSPGGTRISAGAGAPTSGGPGVSVVRTDGMRIGVPAAAAAAGAAQATRAATLAATLVRTRSDRDRRAIRALLHELDLAGRAAAREVHLGVDLLLLVLRDGVAPAVERLLVGVEGVADVARDVPVDDARGTGPLLRRVRDAARGREVRWQEVGAAAHRRRCASARLAGLLLLPLLAAGR